MKGEAKISVNKYAASLSVNESAIRKAIAQGKIKKGYDKVVKKIIPSIADKEYGHLHKIVKPRPGQSKEKLIAQIESAKETGKKEKPGPPPKIEFDDEGLEGDEELISKMKITSDLGYTEILRRQGLINLALEKRKLQELERVLIRKDLVETTLFAMAEELKKALLNLPARITSDVRAADNDVLAQSIMTVELTQILNRAKDLKEIPLFN